MFSSPAKNKTTTTSSNEVTKANSAPEITPGKINGKVINDEVINIKENFINLEGWILDQNKKPVENIFLMINDKPFLKYDDFIPREDIEKTDGNYGWNIIFLSGYLEKGCHEISVIGQNEQKIIEQEKGITICKNE